MRHIDPTLELKNRILLLESRRAAELNLLKAQFRQTAESLKPSNIIKGMIRETDNSPGLMDKLLAAVMGLVAGYLAKKVLTGESKNMLKRMFGTIIQIMVAGFVAKNSEFIKSAGRNLVKRSMGKEKTIVN